MIVRLVALALLIGGSAHASQWVLIQPRALDAGSERLASELGTSLDRALLTRRGERRVGNILAVDEALTVLDCLQLNENCAERAARAVDADGAIYATVRRAGARVLVELNRISLRRRSRLSWRIDLQGHRPSSAELGRLADALSAELFAGEAGIRTGIFADGRLPVRLDGRRRTLDGLVPLPPGSHRIVADGKQMQIDLLPGEIVLLHGMRGARAGRERPRASGGPQRTLGWIGLGAGTLGLAAAGLVGINHLNTVNDYQTAETGARQRAARDAAKDEVLAINALLGIGATTLVTGLILLLTD